MSLHTPTIMSQSRAFFFNYRTMAVIGSGVIGAGIAHVSMDKDFQVILYDTTFHALSRGQSQIEKGYQNSVKRNRITKYKNIYFIIWRFLF